MRVMLWTLLLGLLGLAIVVAFQFHAVNDTRREARAQSCEAWAKHDKVLVDQIRAGEKLIPTLAYYKEHPDEARAAIESNERLVRALVPPEFCEKRR